MYDIRSLPGIYIRGIDVLVLSDKGKAKLKRLFSKKTVLELLIIFVASLTSYFGFYGSKFNQENDDAIALSSLVDTLPEKSLDLVFTFGSVNSNNDFYSFFQKSYLLDKSNRNSDKFDTTPGYVVSNNAFSKNYCYKAPFLFGSEEVSIFPSPVNSLISTDGGYCHEIWNIKLVFKSNSYSNNGSEKNDNYIFLPKSAADNLLLDYGINNPTEDDYRKIIGYPIEIDFYDKDSGQSKQYVWSVVNIIEEDSTYLSYINRFGPSLFCYNYLPQYLYPSCVIRFGHSAFSCLHYLDLISSGKYFEHKLLSVTAASGTSGYLPEPYIDFYSLFNNFGKKGVNNAIGISVCILSTFAGTLLLFTCLKFYPNPENFMICASGYFLSFAVIYIFSKITKTNIFFVASLASMLAVLLIFIFLLLKNYIFQKLSVLAWRMPNDEFKV